MDTSKCFFFKTDNVHFPRYAYITRTTRVVNRQNKSGLKCDILTRHMCAAYTYVQGLGQKVEEVGGKK